MLKRKRMRTRRRRMPDVPDKIKLAQTHRKILCKGFAAELICCSEPDEISRCIAVGAGNLLKACDYEERLLKQFHAKQGKAFLYMDAEFIVPSKTATVKPKFRKRRAGGKG